MLERLRTKLAMRLLPPSHFIAEWPIRPETKYEVWDTWSGNLLCECVDREEAEAVLATAGDPKLTIIGPEARDQRSKGEPREET